jgi:hypothetical protein
MENEEETNELSKEELLTLLNENIEYGNEFKDKLKIICKNSNKLNNSHKSYEGYKCYKSNSVRDELNNLKKEESNLKEKFDEINTKLKIVLSTIMKGNRGVLLDKRLSIREGAFYKYQERCFLNLHTILEIIAEREQEFCDKIKYAVSLNKTKYVFLTARKTSDLETKRSVKIPIEEILLLEKNRFDYNELEQGSVRFEINQINYILVNTNGIGFYSNISDKYQNIDDYTKNALIIKFEKEIIKATIQLKSNLMELSKKYQEVIEEINSLYSKELIYAQMQKIPFTSSDYSTARKVVEED